MLVKAVNAAKKKEEAKEEAPAEPAGPTEIELLQEIRDALAKQ